MSDARDATGRLILPPLLLIAIAGLGVSATGSQRVLLFVGPVLATIAVGLLLGLLGHRRAQRLLILLAAVGSILFGVVTIFSVGVMFFVVGGLLLWAADGLGERSATALASGNPDGSPSL